MQFGLGYQSSFKWNRDHKAGMKQVPTIQEVLSGNVLYKRNYDTIMQMRV